MIKKYSKKWNRLRALKEIIINIYISIIKKDMIIILNIGKVGSTSIYKTLKKHTKSHCFHVHRLSEKGLKKQISFHLRYDDDIPPHIMIVNFFRNKILKNDRELNLIVIIRSPIDRFISYIFQHHSRFKIQPFLSTDSENYKKAIEIVIQKISEEEAWHDFDKWFEEEIYETFCIDVYEQPYSEKIGFNIYKNGNKNLLLMKMERLDTDFTNALKIFLDTPKEIKLEQHNISSEKEYKEEYNLVKNHLKFEKVIIENFTKTKYFQHFFAGQEEELFRRWSK